MITFQLFEVVGGFGYEVMDNGVAFIRQEFHPGVPGDQVMDESTATAEAQTVVDRINASLVKNG